MRKKTTTLNTLLIVELRAYIHLIHEEVNSYHEFPNEKQITQAPLMFTLKILICNS